MSASPKTADYKCPVCQGRGRVPGRLPGRQRLCEECPRHGQGHAHPTRDVAQKKRAAAGIGYSLSFIDRGRQRNPDLIAVQDQETRDGAEHGTTIAAIGFPMPPHRWLFDNSELVQWSTHQNKKRKGCKIGARGEKFNQSRPTSEGSSTPARFCNLSFGNLPMTAFCRSTA